MNKVAAAPIPMSPHESPLSFAAERLQRATGGAAIASVAIPAPVASSDVLLACMPEAPAILWDPPDGPAVTGIGVAAQILGEGAERAEHVRHQAQSTWKELSFVARGSGAPRPRFFGGFSFQPARAVSPPWDGFGDARFVLPRLTYFREAGRAWLLVTANSDDLNDQARLKSLVSDAERALAHLAAPAVSQEQSTPSLRAREGMTPEAWQELVRAIGARIESGACRKIVAARRLRLEFDQPPRDLDVLTELRQASRSCTRFSFRFDRATFLGATPELLVRKTGLRIETEALAGSIRQGHAEKLLTSPKELDEHRLVLDEIVRSLEPVAERIEHPAAPAIRELRHILHLRTPVVARARPEIDVFAFVDLLHPTPAVGGVPRRAAMSFIAEHEPVERGWYAAPVGWFDDRGDGEFDVALRSGVLEGTDAYLFAGSGIVPGSEPDSEYAETELKLASLSTALGVQQ